MSTGTSPRRRWSSLSTVIFSGAVLLLFVALSFSCLSGLSISISIPQSASFEEMGATHSSDEAAGTSALPTGTTSPSPGGSENNTMQDDTSLFKDCELSRVSSSNQTKFVCYICLREFGRKRHLLKHVVCAYEECYSDHLDLFKQPVGDDTPSDLVPLLSNLHEMARQAAADCHGAPLTTLFEGGGDAQVKHEESKTWPSGDWKMELADSHPAFHGTSTMAGCQCHEDHAQAKRPAKLPSKRLHTKRRRPEQPSFDDEHECPEPDYAEAYEDAPALDKTCQVFLLTLYL
jgi:hypothetical protein